MGKTYKLEKAGLEVEIGKFACQANGAVWIKHDKNVVLSTAVSSESERDFAGFFPLMVEYRERTAASGKFPGGFIKREGRLTDSEILGSRLIDRPVRPLFPDFYFNEVQLMSSVLSADGKFPTDILGLIGSSLALTISDIPFLGPIGAVRVARIDGKWKFNIEKDELAKSDIALTVAGTKDGVSMVEGRSDNIPEGDLVEALFLAHEEIKKQVEWQLEIQKDLAVKKATFDDTRWKTWEEKVRNSLPQGFAAKLFDSGNTKNEIYGEIDNLKTFVKEKFLKEVEDKEISKNELGYLFDLALKNLLPDEIVSRNKRLDGRGFDKVRPIKCEIDLLPCVHGSSLFQRGETQALVTVTLGTGKDAQRVEPLIGKEIEKSFLLHYNFPPFSTGEVKMIRGVGRREIGHGTLAEVSFLPVLPDKEKFPYTIRVISDILSSNGSSSMATVCGTTLALMDAGVPVSDMVGGIAMGMIQDSKGKFHTLTDILGIEDALGLMDFKITGTDSGIMAVQMDIKAKDGFSREILADALEKARVARLFILSEMKKIIAVPRPQVSDIAPKIISHKVAQDRIGAIIGPGGKHIKEIIAQTGSEVDIEDDGTVRIFAKNSKNASDALAMVKGLAGEIEIGSEHEGKVRRVADFGILVDIFPGKGGLVHISSIDRALQRDLDRRYPMDSLLKVKVIGYDRETGRIRLIAPELEYNKQGGDK